jgi:hypothetical protein
MMNKKLIIIVCICISGCTNTQTDVPYAEISNDLIKAKIYLPDAEKGYYQGTRFDWAGVIPELEYKGNSYFGQWFSEYHPKIHDAVCGPVESFTVIDYLQTEVGGEFLRIGVGGLLKEDNSRLDNFKLYQISNPGKWTVKKSSDHVTFIHEVNDVAGYSYQYIKTIRLTKDKPEMILEHTLKNIGKKEIKTDTYNHNFFIINHEPTGPNMIIKFPFEVAGKWNEDNDMAVVEGQTIQYLRNFEQNETVFMGNLQGDNPTVQDYDFRIENIKTGTGVRITGDRPLSKMNFWASPTTSCPEPFINISVLPGEQFTWTITYDFYVF